MSLRWFFLLLLSLTPPSAQAGAILVDLGTAAPFAVLAGEAVTNTGATSIYGNVGVWPGSAVTGFPPAIFSAGVIHLTDAVAQQAQNDLTLAFGSAAGQLCGNNLTDQDLGGMTLTSGVYCFDSSAQLTGTLTLNFQGDAGAVFVFQIVSALTTASNSAVTLTNGGSGNRVFWQVGSAATLGTTTAFTGSILAQSSIALQTGASINCGRALARTGEVTMDTNVVSIDTVVCEAAANSSSSSSSSSGGSAVPEPGTALMLGLAAGLMALTRFSAGFAKGAGEGR